MDDDERPPVDGDEAERLRKAEQDLHRAEGDLERAEKEVKAAEHLIEEVVEELSHESKIKVNGRTRTVDGDEVSFDQAAKLAFPAGLTKPNTKFTITYWNAAQVPTKDELDLGQSVKVKRGHNPENETVFNVTETVLS